MFFLSQLNPESNYNTYCHPADTQSQFTTINVSTLAEAESDVTVPSAHMCDPVTDSVSVTTSGYDLLIITALNPFRAIVVYIRHA